jgi:hypothetical protein
MSALPSQRIRHDVFSLALTFCELPKPVIAGTILAEHFHPHGQALIDAGALQPAANRTSIYRDEQEIRIDWDALKNIPAYLDRSGRWRPIPDHELRQYRFRPEWLLPFVSFQFGIPTAIKPRTLLEEIAWELGQTTLGKQRICVLFARRLDQADHQETLSALLKSQRRREDVVVLSSAPIASGRGQQGDRHAFVALEDCRDINSEFFRINKGVIASLLDIPIAAEGFTLGFRSSCFNGVEYTFTKTQAAVLEHLFNAGKAVHKDELLAQSGSAQKKIIDVFRDRKGVHPAYNVILQGDSEGFYRLII